MGNAILIYMNEDVKAVRYQSLKALKKQEWPDEDEKMRDECVLVALERGDPEILDWLLNVAGFKATSGPSPFRCLGVWPGCKYGQDSECRDILIDYLYRTEKNIPSVFGGFIMPPGSLLEGYFDTGEGKDRHKMRKKLAKAINIKHSWVDDLIAGSRRIHPITAYRMEYALQIPYGMTMRLQIAYEYNLNKQGIDPFSVYPQDFTKPSSTLSFMGGR